MSYLNPLQAELQPVGAEPPGRFSGRASCTDQQRALRWQLLAQAPSLQRRCSSQATAEAALLAEQPPAMSCVVLAGV